MLKINLHREQRIAEAKAAIASIDKRIAPLEKRRKIHRDLVDRLEGEILNEKANDIVGGALEDKIQFYLNADNIRHPTAYHDSRKFWESLGIRSSGGSNSKTNQSVLQIDLDQDGSNIEEVYAALSVVTPFVKAIDGVKTFSIFEHTLSRYHSYFLCLATDGWRVVTSGIMQSIRFHDLKKALAYIAENHYYTPIEETESEED